MTEDLAQRMEVAYAKHTKAGIVSVSKQLYNTMLSVGEDELGWDRSY